jgi:3-(3-hydroxy-phenyl)propionate hydroxylase
MTWDLAVVGCGPVGAYAANLFGRAGLRTLVLDRETAPYGLPRAVHFDHEMLRLLADAGLLEAIEDRLRAAHGHLHIGADYGVIRHLSAVGQPQPFGYANDYFFFQPELEEVLRAGLGRYANVSVRLGTEVVGLAQSESGVRLTLDDGGTVCASWVLGTDGARSTVRKALGVQLDDLEFEEPWLVVDAEVDGPIRFPELTGVAEGIDLQRLSVMMCDPRRPATIVPGRGTHRRWEFMLLPGEEDGPMAEAARVAELLAPWVGGAPHRVIRAATYRFHGLVAQCWRRGGCFLAGDAAHQTPPFFGQGMCHGMRDVANLAWKLVLVHGRKAGSGLLDTYQTERDGQVRQVIGKAIEAGRYICVLDPVKAADRDVRVRATPDVKTAADLIGPLASSIVAEGAGVRFINPPINRGRALLDDVTGGGWVLLTRRALALTNAAAAVLGDLECKVVQLPDDLEDSEGHLAAWFDAKGADAALVRPDFYLAAAGADARALSDEITRIGAAMHLS